MFQLTLHIDDRLALLKHERSIGVPQQCGVQCRESGSFGRPIDTKKGYQLMERIHS